MDDAKRFAELVAAKNAATTLREERRALIAHRNDTTQRIAEVEHSLRMANEHHGHLRRNLIRDHVINRDEERIGEETA